MIVRYHSSSPDDTCLASSSVISVHKSSSQELSSNITSSTAAAQPSKGAARDKDSTKTCSTKALSKITVSAGLVSASDSSEDEATVNSHRRSNLASQCPYLSKFSIKNIECSGLKKWPFYNGDPYVKLRVIPASFGEDKNVKDRTSGSGSECSGNVKICNSINGDTNRGSVKTKSVSVEGNTNKLLARARSSGGDHHWEDSAYLLPHHFNEVKTSLSASKDNPVSIGLFDTWNISQVSTK